MTDLFFFQYLLFLGREIYGELDETGLYVMRRHRDLPEIYGDAPAAVAAAKSYTERHLKIIESHLMHSEYVTGAQFGFADILLGSCLDWAKFYDLELTGIQIGRAHV